MGEGVEGSEPCIVTAICQRRTPVQREGVDGCNGWHYGGSLSGDERALEATSAAFQV